MLEKAPFSELFLQAWRASLPKTATLIFGMLAASGVVMEQLVAQALWQPVPGSPAAGLRDAWIEHTAILFAASIAMFLVHVFGQANLIAALSGRSRMSFQKSDMVSRCLKALAVDGATIGVLGVLVAVFAAPPLMAFSANRGAFEEATLLSVLAFLPVLVAVLFIRQYGLFYYLLSTLRFRSSIDQGAIVFSRFIVRSSMFWAFSFMIAAVFTFFLNAAMLGTSAQFIKSGFGAFSDQAAFSVGLVGLVWFVIFDQALSLRFFEDLVTTDKAEEQAVTGEQMLDSGMPVA